MVNKLKKLVTKKEDGAEGVVVAIVLIIVAVALVGIFKTSIGGAIKTAIADIQLDIQDMFTI